MLDRRFEAPAPNRKWIADFTYIWTAEGWLYEAAVIDLFSRRGPTLARELFVIQAKEWDRRPQMQDLSNTTANEPFQREAYRKRA